MSLNPIRAVHLRYSRAQPEAPQEEDGEDHTLYGCRQKGLRARGWRYNGALVSAAGVLEPAQNLFQLFDILGAQTCLPLAGLLEHRQGVLHRKCEKGYIRTYRRQSRGTQSQFPPAF